MTYIIHPDLPERPEHRPDVANPAAWVRSGWSKDPDQTPAPLPGLEPEDEQPASQPAEQPARRSTKEH